LGRGTSTGGVLPERGFGAKVRTFGGFFWGGGGFLWGFFGGGGCWGGGGGGGCGVGGVFFFFVFLFFVFGVGEVHKGEKNSEKRALKLWKTRVKPFFFRLPGQVLFFMGAST